MDVAALAQYGGFAVLAGLAIVALWKQNESAMRQIQNSHERETVTLQAALSDRSSMVQLAFEVAKESTAAVTSLSDEVAGLRHDLKKVIPS